MTGPRRGAGEWRAAVGDEGARAAAAGGYATVHPSYLLRLPDEATRQAAYGQFRDDLARGTARDPTRSA